MAYVKAADIEMMETRGTFQIAIGDHCVTDYNYKTKDACYKAYIVELINSIEKTRSALTNNTGF
jgi:hypothetical protein